MNNQQFTKDANNITWKKVLLKDLKFGVALKTLPLSGNLAYEYNPLQNYRVNLTSYQYKNRLYTLEELAKELNKTVELILKIKGDKWPEDWIPVNETDPILLEPGLVADFETDLLHFDLSHPVQILPQYSYDNSVNLILNDGLNPPKLINSRFSPIGRNRYEIIDRKGDLDTNIYDLGEQFELDTSLYKKTILIPSLTFLGVHAGGEMKVGNYHFYFSYLDADGNETDIIAESGLVSLFIGTSPGTCRLGYRDENCHKTVKFKVSNIDPAYSYVQVYFTKATSDINENATVSAFRINQKFFIENDLLTTITITGLEDITEVPLSDINIKYQVVDSAETLEACQNRLFMANIVKPDMLYQELSDIALRFLPVIEETPYELSLDRDYNVSSNKGYYDPDYIYHSVGYENGEIYRLGMVFILSNNTLSPVFNIRGKEGLSVLNNNDIYSIYSKIPFKDTEGKRKYISIQESTYRILSESGSESESGQYENAKGVIKLNVNSTNIDQVYGIKIHVDYEVLQYLRDTLHIQGIFFVRQKRIPLKLCLAYTIGIDKESSTPVIPIIVDSKKEYVAESFINSDRLLVHDFESRKRTLPENLVRIEAAICPDYDINLPYYNSLFTGDQFVIKEALEGPKDLYLQSDGRHFFSTDYEKKFVTPGISCRVLGVEDNVKLVAINNSLFSARAGESEEAFRFKYLGKENKVTEATNLIRGSFGPYLAITGYNQSGHLIDIYIPGYNESQIGDYFGIRYNDKSSFYAISERLPLNNFDSLLTEYETILNGTTPKLVSFKDTLYRGDSYICQFTHRVNRNFLDPSAPMNDDIIDKNCWKDNYAIKDDVLDTDKSSEINLGDVNAIKLGMWVTFKVRSSHNLNIRALDDSIPDEMALVGHPRGFYPYYPISADGAYKIPESFGINKGYDKSLSERYNFEVPDVPYIKNEFSNRVIYSDIAITDAFLNGFRVFKETNYRDYPKTYGSITKLVELDGDLVCIFEHGVGVLSVNERVISGDGTGGPVYINTQNVLPEAPFMLSDSFGSQWKESIVKTPKAIYGVDTVGKKIWRCTKSNFEVISNFSVLKFLNDNISLTERELTPIIGIRNVKTHYNANKGDVMFTFYDNLHGFEEKAWNLCWNESLDIWVTFYSWIPSYSENIYNQYFSFDRNTSKYIAKLGISNSNNDFSDGVTLDNNILSTNFLTFNLKLSNRFIQDVDYDITFEIVRDNYGNWKNFELLDDKKTLKFIGNYTEVCSEFYQRVAKDGSILFSEKDIKNNFDENTKEWKFDYRIPWINSLSENSLKIYKNDRGLRVWIDRPYQINPDKLVIYLNLRAHVNMIIPTTGNTSLQEAIKTKQTNRTVVDMGYYESVVAIIPKYNLLFLTTDFWKHGRAGIIDIADKIYPTYWYGKLHPFEFEFVVSDSPECHKIFDNLEIISNKAAPESFHYEIIGDCYEFAKDKKNMYIRQEATKELYLFNGSNILFDLSYKELLSEHRPLTPGDPDPKLFDKSTIFPAYYCKLDTINEIEDYYHLYKDNGTKGNKDFSALAGAELVRYKDLDEYRIQNHAKAVDITEEGLLRGNMYYKEDIWNVLINPINFVQKNESKDDWKNKYKLNGEDRYDLVPAECNLFPPPASQYKHKEDGESPNLATLPDDWERNIVSWKDYQKINKEAKVKDKFIKIRIRYSGKNLAIISAIRTLYSISYA